MIITPNGYKLLKESYIEIQERQSFLTHPYYNLRKKLEIEGYYKQSNNPGCLILNKDIDFSSPSAAASIVKNRATNGKKEWKLKDGTTLDDYELQSNT